ncbi:hypothetical protein EIP91_005994 [Steccherinum ochraceum]|uniref:Protein kinase domain-containing protein n=1 Tax=Steccherinum ochraceum TaxID=92696 RepID=A0A4R0R6R2_9APHY|nr:hypothetical protein EIP91_005994 [Steccherinum ochraceum]
MDLMKEPPQSQCIGSLIPSDRCLTQTERLLDDEYWRGQYNFLLSKGYRLRSYFHPEPSSRSPEVSSASNSWFREPSADCDLSWWRPPFVWSPDAMDATDSVGSLVTIRSMQSDNIELGLLRRFSRLSIRADGYNHCIPITEEFSDPADPSVIFVVTPYLVKARSQKLLRIDDFTELCEQILEGITFFHEQGITNVFLTQYDLPVGLETGALNPRGNYFRPNFYFNWYRRYYFSRLNECQHEVTGIAPAGDSSKERETRQLKAQSEGPAETNSKRRDLQNFAAYVDHARQLNRWTLSCFEDLLKRMLEDDYPPDAKVALKEWIEVRDNMSWLKKGWWVNTS